MPRKSAPKTPHAELEGLLGHHFKQPERLTLALTHRSFIAEGSGRKARETHPSEDNEQLEFLGDAILGLIAAEALCQRFPDSREGTLTRVRASVISRRHLGVVGRRLELGRFLRLGQTAGRHDLAQQNTAIFANAVEALIAALYLDGGLKAARRFVEAEILAGALPTSDILIDGPQFSGDMGDHKSSLQELLQAGKAPRPRYHLLSESGPAHRRLYRMEVRLEGAAAPLAEAESTSKKSAEQEAARLALIFLAAHPESIPQESQPLG